MGGGGGYRPLFPTPKEEPDKTIRSFLYVWCVTVFFIYNGIGSINCLYVQCLNLVVGDNVVVVVNQATVNNYNCIQSNIQSNIQIRKQP